MRGTSKFVLALGVLVGCFLGISSKGVSAQNTGLTITPATLTLSVPKGETDKTTTFTLSNHYPRPVTIRFAFEARTGSPSSTNPGSYLKLAQDVVTIDANGSFTQTILFRDETSVTPGSHQADLVITQIAAQTSDVSVQPSVRMPVVLVKEDGAISSIALTKLSGSGFHLTMPESLTATISNTGNMIAIPRGFVQISTIGGSVIRKGVLNTSSFAVSPSGNVALATPLNALNAALWPGFYKTTVSYGLGGGQASASVSSWFVYVAWWHLVILVCLIVAARYLRTYVAARTRKARFARRLKRPAFASRNAA